MWNQSYSRASVHRFQSKLLWIVKPKNCCKKELLTKWKRRRRARDSKQEMNEFSCVKKKTNEICKLKITHISYKLNRSMNHHHGFLLRHQFWGTTTSGFVWICAGPTKLFYERTIRCRQSKIFFHIWTTPNSLPNSTSTKLFARCDTFISRKMNERTQRSKNYCHFISIVLSTVIKIGIMN